MQITDTIADLLTRIRNANTAKHATVDVPASRGKKDITQILVDEGYVKGFQLIEDGKQGVIRITLKYGDNKSPVITGLRRVSKPGLRIYASCEDMLLADLKQLRQIKSVDTLLLGLSAVYSKLNIIYHLTHIHFYY